MNYDQPSAATAIAEPLAPSVVFSSSESRTSPELEGYVCLESMQPSLIDFSPPPTSATFAIDTIGSPSSSASRKRKREMAVPRFPCPVFQDEVKNGLPHTCNGGGGNTMSELRTHMKRRTKERPPHLEFLKRCAICNKDITDKFDYSDSHGPKCHDSHPVRKGEKADEQYRMLCALVVPILHTDPNASRGKSMRDIIVSKLIQMQATIRRHTTVLLMSKSPLEFSIKSCQQISFLTPTFPANRKAKHSLLMAHPWTRAQNANRH
jgi:hypothetical protein